MAEMNHKVGSMTILAAAALGKQLFVGLTGGLCGAGEKALGVTELDFASGEYATVVTDGVMLVKAGGAVSAKAAVVSDANGKAVAATTMSATVPSGATTVTSSSAQPAMTIAGSVLPEAINGYALDAASAEDDLIRVKLI